MSAARSTRRWFAVLAAAMLLAGCGVLLCLWAVMAAVLVSVLLVGLEVVVMMTGA